MATYTCEICGGTGIQPGTESDPCVTCGGDGQMQADWYKAMEIQIANTLEKCTDTLDKCTDILDKCNDIKELMDEHPWW